MKLSRIEVNNFLAIKDFSGDLAPLSVFCGKNGVGKSSLKEGLSFVFTGDTGRAGKQTKTSKELLHRGAEGGTVTVQFDGDKTVSRDVTTGAILGPRFDYPVALPFVLKADEFCKDTTDRRSALFSIMGLSAGVEEIMKRLAEKKIDPEVVGAVKHLLAGGCPPALTEAEKKRTLDKGAWCEVTGARQYGKVIAEKWEAEANGPTLEELTAKYGTWEEIQTDLVAWNNIIADQNQLIGMFNAYQEGMAKLPELREKGKQHATLTAAANDLRKQYNALKDELETLGAQGTSGKPVAAGHRNPATEPAQQIMECPCCTKKLVYKAGKLVEYTAPEAKAEAKPVKAGTDPNKDRRDEITKQMGELYTKVAAAETKVKEADEAISLANSLEKQELKQELADAPEQLKDAEQGLKECQQAEQEVKAARDAAGQQKAKTDRAKALHVSVVKWEQLVAALSPEGIPAEILKDAMGPLDAQLQGAAEATGWPLVSLDENMAVSIGAFSRKLTGESYTWRGDAMMAVSLAVVSGVRVVSLDRCDVLDAPSRMVLINWLLGLIDAGVLDTVLLYMTLKTAPDLGEGTCTYWLE